jgi:hypothetical protein
MHVFPSISSAQQWVWNRCRLLLCMSVFLARNGHADCKRVAEQTGILTKEPDHPPQEC